MKTIIILIALTVISCNRYSVTFPHIPIPLKFTITVQPMTYQKIVNIDVSNESDYYISGRYVAYFGDADSNGSLATSNTITYGGGWQIFPHYMQPFGQNDPISGWTNYYTLWLKLYNSDYTFITNIHFWYK